MKFLTIILLFVSFTCFGQNLKYSEINKMKRGKYQSYESKDGVLYQLGDTLRVGTPTGQQGQYSYIYQANALTGTSRMAGPELSEGFLVIKKIHSVGNKRTGFRAHFQCYGNLQGSYMIYFESAVSSKEIRSNF